MAFLGLRKDCERKVCVRELASVFVRFVVKFFFFFSGAGNFLCFFCRWEEEDQPRSTATKVAWSYTEPKSDIFILFPDIFFS